MIRWISTKTCEIWWRRHEIKIIFASSVTSAGNWKQSSLSIKKISNADIWFLFIPSRTTCKTITLRVGDVIDNDVSQSKYSCKPTTMLHELLSERSKKRYLMSVQRTKNTKKQFLFAISASHRLMHGYVHYMQYTYITLKTRDRHLDRRKSLQGDATSAHDDNPWCHQWRQRRSNQISLVLRGSNIDYDWKLVRMWYARRNSSNRKKIR